MRLFSASRAIPLAASRALKLRSPRKQIVDAARRGLRARHLADEMHDRFALSDIVFEHAQRIAAEQLEILLDFDLDVRPGQRSAQSVTVAAELVGDAGEEKFDAVARHRPPPLRIARAGNVARRPRAVKALSPRVGAVANRPRVFGEGSCPGLRTGREAGVGGRRK